MSRTVKEKAKEWGCGVSTVSSYCASGIIPPAEKIGKRSKWSIPAEWPKPPIARRGLCYLLDTIYQINHGVSFESVNWGFSEDKVKDGYAYLIGAAFMSTIDIENLPKTLITASVTPRGKALIERENAESKGKTSFKAHLTAKANIGIASVEAGLEVSHE